MAIVVCAKGHIKGPVEPTINYLPIKFTYDKEKKTLAGKVYEDVFSRSATRFRKPTHLLLTNLIRHLISVVL